MTHSVLILNGPNLNMLGKREPGIYGAEKLTDIEQHCQQHAKKNGLSITFQQSNIEGELVGWIQDAMGKFDGIIINAGAYTHTSIALHDAFRATAIPFIEVHISNVYARENFRHKSYLSAIAQGVLCGFGSYGYIMALDGLQRVLEKGK